MAMITVRNLSDEVHRALRIRAAENGRSTEAEVRTILRSAVLPEKRRKLGSALRELWQSSGLTEEEYNLISNHSKNKPAEPMEF